MKQKNVAVVHRDLILPLQQETSYLFSLMIDVKCFKPSQSNLLFYEIYMLYIIRHYTAARVAMRDLTHIDMSELSTYSGSPLKTDVIRFIFI